MAQVEVCLPEGSPQRARHSIKARQTAPKERWQYLDSRPHPWRRQLYVKGRRQRAYSIWSTMLINKFSVEQSADNWELPTEAIQEIIQYCEQNEDLLRREAAEEGRLLREAGIHLEPPPVH